MNTTELRKLHSKILRQVLRRRDLWLALVISVAGTALLGGILLALLDNVWWLALGGLVSLFGGGLYMGWQNREPEPLHGSLLAVIYFGLVVGFLFGMELAQKLPNPLPGLPRGDSTFFFVSPLLMLVASVAGSVLGGRPVRIQRAREKE
ncbi:MAG: hypothetical protein V3U79_02880 [Dehalococcoidia bacterium]